MYEITYGLQVEGRIGDRSGQDGEQSLRCSKQSWQSGWTSQFAFLEIGSITHTNNKFAQSETTIESFCGVTTPYLDVNLEAERLSPGNLVLLNQVEVDIFVGRTGIEHGLGSFNAARSIHGRQSLGR